MFLWYTDITKIAEMLWCILPTLSVCTLNNIEVISVNCFLPKTQKFVSFVAIYLYEIAILKIVPHTNTRFASGNDFSDFPKKVMISLWR